MKNNSVKAPIEARAVQGGAATGVARVAADGARKAGDLDFDWVDPNSLEALPPLSSQDVLLHFEGEVTQGQFAPVEVDDVDLEIFD